MPAVGKTAVQQYRSVTAGVRPSALLGGEMFLNQADNVMTVPDVANVPKDVALDTTMVLTADYTNATTTISTVHTFQGVANAVYEVEWLAIWQASATTLGLKLSLSTPAGAIQSMLALISSVQNGVTSPTFLELGTSATAQSGPVAAVAAVPTIAQARGLIVMGTTAGAIVLGAAATTTGTVTIKAGSSLKYRRIR